MSGKEKGYEPFSAYGDMLTVSNLCEIYEQCPNVIRRMCVKGELPALKVGKFWYVPKWKLIEQMGGASNA